MNRAILSQRITEILTDITRLSNTLYALNMTDVQRYRENYEVLSTDAALRAEQITCRLRHLIYSTTNVGKEKYLASAAEAQGIEIVENDSILEIKLPALLPKRRQRKSTEFLLDPFMAALGKYVEEHKMSQMSHCVICFAQVYNKNLPDRRIRDYDNLEFKQLLDVIASYILADDNGLLVDAYHTAELGDEDCTRIFVMESSRFKEWLDGREDTLQSITDL